MVPTYDISIKKNLLLNSIYLLNLENFEFTIHVLINEPKSKSLRFVLRKCHVSNQAFFKLSILVFSKEDLLKPVYLTSTFINLQFLKKKFSRL